MRAANNGDHATATALAAHVLSVDHGNPEAEDLLATPARYGEIRRLTIMFADLVDSTALSTRLEPEAYHTLVGRYRQEVQRIIDRYEGHISSIKGDGLLAVFGHPRPHDDDARRERCTCGFAHRPPILRPVSRARSRAAGPRLWDHALGCGLPMSRRSPDPMKSSISSTTSRGASTWAK